MKRQGSSTAAFVLPAYPHVVIAVGSCETSTVDCPFSGYDTRAFFSRAQMVRDLRETFDRYGVTFTSQLHISCSDDVFFDVVRAVCDYYADGRGQHEEET